MRKLLAAAAGFAVVVPLLSLAGPAAANTAPKRADRLYLLRVLLRHRHLGDGSRRVQPTQHHEQRGHPAVPPDWSPDGTQLTFFRYVEGVAISTQADIFVMNADGSNPTNITNTDTEELEPARSPDGDRLVFSATRVPEASGSPTGRS
ncbi:MAG: PD40 domain-containing protein [Geodermatophilaceae bacterium]|nr:PD40 domain-containing protein [Geodermatophilaceae bacterium]